MTVRVYDSPAARLAAEQSPPQGKSSNSYRCFATCGAVSVEVSAEETKKDLLAWANNAASQSQSALGRTFGGCPAWDDTSSTQPQAVPATGSTAPLIPLSPCQAAQLGRLPTTTRVNLAGCDLLKADLSGADLSNAVLSEASLAGADLTGANLSGARLDDASLYRANLSDADLTGAYLRGADMGEANLTRANLTGATPSFLDSGVIWSSTTCPDGSNSDSHNSTCVGYGFS